MPTTTKPITISAEAYAAQQTELARLRAQVKQLPPSDLQGELEALRAENQRLQAQVNQPQPKKSPITLSAKGCVVLNLGQGWPIALYPGQWEQVLTVTDDLKALVTAHTLTKGEEN